MLHAPFSKFQKKRIPETEEAGREASAFLPAS